MQLKQGVKVSNQQNLKKLQEKEDRKDERTKNGQASQQSRTY